MMGVSFIIHNEPGSLVGVYANEVTLGGSLESFRMGVGSQRNPKM